MRLPPFTSWLISTDGIWSIRGHELYCPRLSQSRLPARNVKAKDPAYGFNTGFRQPARDQLPARLEDLSDRYRSPAGHQSRRPRGRLPVPGRPLRRWQVDGGAAPHQGGEANEGQDLRRRRRDRPDEAPEAAVLPAQDRPGLPGLQALAQPDRVRERGLRDARPGRARPLGAVTRRRGAGHRWPGWEGADISLEPVGRRAAARGHRTGAG